MARACCIEGLNQAGKSTAVRELCLLLKEMGYIVVLGKLPDYFTPFGDYIRNRFLPNFTDRPDDLKRSIVAQMSLYALNRLEMLSDIRTIVQDYETLHLGERVIVVFDRSPLSSLFTYIDSLLYGDLRTIIDADEDEKQAIVKIKNLIERAQISNEVFQLSKEYDPTLDILYAGALGRILQLEDLFLREFHPISLFVLDIPVERIMEIQGSRDIGKELDVQEHLPIQSVVRELYLRTVGDSALREIMTIHILNQMRGGERLDISQIVREMIRSLQIERLEKEDFRYIRIPVCRGFADFSEHPDLEGAFMLLAKHPCLRSVRDAIEFATIYGEGLHHTQVEIG